MSSAVAAKQGAALISDEITDKILSPISEISSFYLFGLR